MKPKTENRKPKTRLLLLLVLVTGVTFFYLNSALPQETLEAQGISFRLIPGGTYLLGSPTGEPGRYADESLPHQVRLGPFYLAVQETTNAQYGRFLKATGHPAPLYWEDKNLNAPNQPVVGVTWEDAVAFTQWLTQATGVPHRLPTEQEWEAASRGGLIGQPFPWGSAAPDAAGVFRANYRANDLSKRRFHLTAPVGSFPANGFGLFDMAGNVAEWCLDRYHPLGSGGPFKPRILRLLKGGSWYSSARDLRCAARQSAAPDYTDGYIGFRVVRPFSSAH
ncbi:MAG: formylglycine-generating enzyme family protein [Deltaproteobacteria bacterium]|nr:formylglycine-generating enzyme family protein [Deltaproteobacteria bacterium]